MPSISLEQAQQRLAAYLEAETAALKSQSYEIEGRRLTRADLAEIRRGIAECRAEVAQLSGAASGRPMRSRVIVPGG